MEESSSTLTVLFEEPFWVGIYERRCQGQYQVCKIVFGAEPKNAEIHQYLLDHWRYLHFSPVLTADAVNDRRPNPKRMQRAISKQVHNSGIGTKAQQALKLQQEEGKLARRRLSREQREQEQARHFALKQRKRQQKHRGH